MDYVYEREDCHHWRWAWRPDTGSPSSPARAGGDVFEREKHALQRPQGGSLDLHETSGQLALKRAGPHDAFLGIAHYEDQGVHVLDKHGVGIGRNTSP